MTDQIIPPQETRPNSCFTPPFSIYHDAIEIGDANGHVCTAENPMIANEIVAILNAAFVPAAEAPVRWEQIGWLRDFNVDGEEVTEICFEGDPGAYAVYRGTPTHSPAGSGYWPAELAQKEEIKRLRAQVEEMVVEFGSREHPDCKCNACDIIRRARSSLPSTSKP